MGHFPETSAQTVGKKRCLRWRTHSCVPRRHFPQTSAQTVGNKGEPEAEVCGARDVPEGIVCCSCRHPGFAASRGVANSGDAARKSACATSESAISNDLRRGCWKVRTRHAD